MFLGPQARPEALPKFELVLTSGLQVCVAEVLQLTDVSKPVNWCRLKRSKNSTRKSVWTRSVNMGMALVTLKSSDLLKNSRIPRALGALPNVKLAAGVKAAWFKMRLWPQTYLPWSAPIFCPLALLGRPCAEPVAPSGPAKMPEVQPDEDTLSGVPL